MVLEQTKMHRSLYTQSGEDIAQMPMWKSYLYHLQQQAPKPKRIVCQREVSSRPTYYGREYHGDISREDADFLLTIGGEGSYLIRESQRARGQYTLAIRFDGVTKNFKLYYDGQHYVGEKRFDTVQDLVADGLIIFYLEAKAHDYISSLSSQSNYAESPYVAYNTQRKKHLAGSMPRSARRAQREQQIAAQKALEEVQKSPAPQRSQNNLIQQPDGIIVQQAKAQRDSSGGDKPKPAERTNIPYTRQESSSRKVAVNIPVEGARLSQILETRQDAKQNITKPTSKNENETIGAIAVAPPKVPQSPAPELLPRKTRQSRSQQPADTLNDAPPAESAPLQPSTDAGSSAVGAEQAPPGGSVTDGPERVKVSHSTNTDGPMLDDFSTPPSSPPPPGQPQGQHALDYDPANFKLSSVSWCTDYLEVMGSEKPHNFKLHTFKGPHWCDYCANFLWGLIAQGVKCQDCGFNAHKKCSEKVPNDCMPDMKYVKRMFGVDLTTLVKAQNTLIPAVCEACIKEIEKRGLDSEGLYRVAGFHDDVESIKMLFDKDEFTDITTDKYEDINTITSVLKLYLRLLPIPLVTFDIYYTVIEIIKREDITDDKRAELLRQTYNQLPPAHYHTFKYLSGHLSRVTDHRQQNMMNPDNLAIVFAPTLLRSPETDPLSGLTAVKYERELIEFTIIHQATIFE